MVACSPCGYVGPKHSTPIISPQFVQNPSVRPTSKVVAVSSLIRGKLGWNMQCYYCEVVLEFLEHGPHWPSDA